VPKPLYLLLTIFLLEPYAVFRLAPKHRRYAPDSSLAFPFRCSLAAPLQRVRHRHIAPNDDILTRAPQWPNQPWTDGPRLWPSSALTSLEVSYEGKPLANNLWILVLSPLVIIPTYPTRPELWLAFNEVIGLELANRGRVAYTL
jgi:hypothetical protein